MRKNVVDIFNYSTQKRFYVPKDDFKAGVLLYRSADDVYNAEKWATQNMLECIFFYDDEIGIRAGICNYYRVLQSYVYDGILLKGRQIEQSVRNSMYAHGLYSHSIFKEST